MFSNVLCVNKDIIFLKEIVSDKLKVAKFIELEKHAFNVSHQIQLADFRVTSLVEESVFWMIQTV